MSATEGGDVSEQLVQCPCSLLSRRHASFPETQASTVSVMESAMLPPAAGRAAAKPADPNCEVTKCSRRI